MVGGVDFSLVHLFLGTFFFIFTYHSSFLGLCFSSSIPECVFPPYFRSSRGGFFVPDVFQPRTRAPELVILDWFPFFRRELFFSFLFCALMAFPLGGP